ncbi:lysosomal alpha-glucosidase-like isoform X2 [Ornithodoros turicata]|uniref:lysosomal alpha-glucosidase-like isoform X2 n=1 Tax=Ornithodoros turicata TaxID=34597 RepID=UPI0031387F7A
MLRAVIMTLCFFAMAHNIARATRHRTPRNVDDPENVVDDPDLAAKCETVAMDDRIECPVPGHNMDDTLCNQVGCCVNRNFDHQPELCFFPPDYMRYRVISIDDDRETINITLEVNNPMKLLLTEHSVSVSVSYHSKEVARVLVDRVRLPGDEYTYFPRVPILAKGGVSVDDIMYDVVPLTNGMLNINRRDEGGGTEKGVPIFSSNFSYMTFDQHYKQLTLFLASRSVYGLGTRLTPLQLPILSDFFLFNRELGPERDGMGRSTHPMYMCLERGGKAHGVYLHNSNAMEVKLRPQPSVTFKAYGGKLDFYVFMGPTPADVVRQYLELVGKPTMPPYWGLGYHHSRHGYESLQDIRNFMLRSSRDALPVESVWVGHETYADDHFIFTLSERFRGLKQVVGELHSKNQYCVLNFPPFVRKPSGEYHTYDQGLQMKAFVRNYSGLFDPHHLATCTVQRGVDAVYVDFTADDAMYYWGAQLRLFHDDLYFDGAWLTHTNPRCYHRDASQCDSASDLEHPSANPPERLNLHTLCMEDQFFFLKHYDMHNLYGYYAAMITHEAMVHHFYKRPFIMTGTTFAGQGKWSGQWTGESNSTWESMRESIPMILTSNLLGMPFVGADICGTNGNATPSLCARWHALGAFYPFARNHNGKGFVDQDPAALFISDQVRSPLRTRLELLPYLYTLFYRNSVHGEPVMRPLFYEFPEDQRTHNIDTQFMWGPALLINPILYPDVTGMAPYIPREVWFDYYTGEPVLRYQGTKGECDAKSVDICILIRWGYVIPIQEPGLTTAERHHRDGQLHAL